VISSKPRRRHRSRHPHLRAAPLAEPPLAVPEAPAYAPAPAPEPAPAPVAPAPPPPAGDGSEEFAPH